MLGCKYICASSQFKSHQPTSATEVSRSATESACWVFPAVSGGAVFLWTPLLPVSSEASRGIAVSLLVTANHVLQEGPLEHRFSAWCMWYGTFIGTRKKKKKITYSYLSRLQGVLFFSKHLLTALLCRCISDNLLVWLWSLALGPPPPSYSIGCLLRNTDY